MILIAQPALVLWRSGLGEALRPGVRRGGAAQLGSFFEIGMHLRQVARNEHLEPLGLSLRTIRSRGFILEPTNR